MSDEGQIEQKPVKRSRKRNMVPVDKRGAIAERVVKFYNDEITNRQPGRNARLQRYAKYRMWTQGTNWPWPDASDVSIPDMLQDSLRIQDTLHNAVLSQVPPVVSNANKEIDKDKQKTIDNLLQHQFFVENPGEQIIGDLAEAFVNDPSATVFLPWVREKKCVADIRVFDPIPEDAVPKDYFFSLVKAAFKDARKFDSTDAGWDWDVTLADDKEVDVSFFTDEAGEVEMVTETENIVYDAPRPFVKDYDDVLYPARSANLQPPGPANPGGAPYVILRDFPILSEIKGLQDSGYYDMLSDDDLEKLGKSAPSPKGESQAAQQKDVLQGSSEKPGPPQDESHKKLTRLMCFDTFDIDGDGLCEDVVFWVILETKTLLRVRKLSDISPGSPPRRPLFGGCFLPVGGRRDGMSLLEIMEGIHDTIKVMVDQGINANDLAIASPGYYRPSGGMNPEVLRIEPFTLSPLQNPQQDVVFPQMGNAQAMGFSLNMINMLGMWQDKATMVSDLQFGQVPGGSSSALRTIGGMSLAMGQGDARPERILRRFFMILTDVYAHMHRLNQNFLPKGKEFRIVGFVRPDQNPYVKIDTPDNIQGEYNFSFDANAFNTSKQALQQALKNIMGVLINPLTIQLGVVGPDEIYNMLSDYVKAMGQNAPRYVKPSTPDADEPQILAEEAISEIMRNQAPVGRPLESGGAQEHMQKLVAFMESDDFGHLTKAQVDLFRQYLLQVRQSLMAQSQQQSLVAHAGTFAQQANQQGPGAPPTLPPQLPGPPAPVSGPAELQNEKLPGSGGGANASA